MADTGTLGEAQLFALRQISDNLAAQTRRLEGLGAKVDDVRERLLSRIDALEAQRDRVAGAAAFWTWLGRHAPWLAAALAAFGAGLVAREGGQ
ncbi:MAG: hypothetical protein LW695_09330 [Phenylobacterium sp.]|nr:hypothetical protein [Phenylobacterium sp.]